MSANGHLPAEKKSAMTLKSPEKSESQCGVTLGDIVVLVVMHALITKEPYPEPVRVVGQAREWSKEFINQRSEA